MDDSLLYKRRARICQVLWDPTRLRLIDAQRDGERSVGQLAEALGATYPNISRHLNVMRDTGLVTSRRDGTTIYYRLAYPQLLQAVTLYTTCSVPSLSTRARWLAAEQPLSVHTPQGYTESMPLFEYACANCGRADEHLVRVPAPERVTCTACGAEARRLMPLLARSGGECSPAVSGST